jgi:branched-chain amino acid aminotransferase
MTSAGQTIEFVRSTSPYPAEYRSLLMAEPRFGTVFTDHMFTAKWHDGGWQSARVGPREPFSIDPACAVLHYAQEIFEGMKAYRTVDGGLVLFRPDRNASRFAESARRMAMPVVPADLFINAVQALVDVDREWVPEGEGSLYLRPFMFASEAFLGVRPSAEYVFCVIACPVGPYFVGGSRAISLWVTDQYTRAALGGTGAAKCGGNYAAGLLAQAEAKERGCDQTVFLDADEHRWVEELGGMNLFFVMRDGNLITPPLSGTILPGITRESIIELARERGMSVVERRYSIDEWRTDAATGVLAEVFACGTAATVVGVGSVRSRNGDFLIGDGSTGPATIKLCHELLGVQRGEIPDPREWTFKVGSPPGLLYRP